MTVYVDDMYLYPMGQFGRMKMSHMMADTTEELLAMAHLVSVSKRWIQSPGTYAEHFDISKSKRDIAVANGAIEITMREMAAYQRKKRDDHTARLQPSQDSNDTQAPR